MVLLSCYESKWAKSFSCVWLFATPWTVAYQAPPSIGFSRQGYWSGLPFPSPGDLPNPGNEPGSSTLQTDTLPPKPPGKPGICQAPKWSETRNCGEGKVNAQIVLNPQNACQTLGTIMSSFPIWKDIWETGSNAKGPPRWNSNRQHCTADRIFTVWATMEASMLLLFSHPVMSDSLWAHGL